MEVIQTSFSISGLWGNQIDESLENCFASEDSDQRISFLYCMSSSSGEETGISSCIMQVVNSHFLLSVVLSGNIITAQASFAPWVKKKETIGFCFAYFILCMVITFVWGILNCYYLYFFRMYKILLEHIQKTLWSCVAIWSL